MLRNQSPVLRSSYKTRSHVLERNLTRLASYGTTMTTYPLHGSIRRRPTPDRRHSMRTTSKRSHDPFERFPTRSERVLTHSTTTSACASHN